MVGSRTATALAGLAVSVAVSIAAWYYLDSLLVFLFVPFVPFLFRGGDRGARLARRRCPVCDFETGDPEFEFCPRDGTRLERR